IVGDVDVEAAIASVASTFGVLPKRRAPNPWTERRKFPSMKSGVHENYAIDTQVQKALVLIEFPLTDGQDAATRRNLRFLGNVVADRLRVEIREKLGASYSPNAAANPSTVYPGVGMLTIQ